MRSVRPQRFRFLFVVPRRGAGVVAGRRANRRCGRPFAGDPPLAGPFVRVSLLSPADRPWRGPPRRPRAGRQVTGLVRGRDRRRRGQGGGVPAGGAIDRVGGPVRRRRPRGGDRPIPIRDTARSRPGGRRGPDRRGLRGRRGAILRSVTDHDPGNVISVRIPPDPADDKDRILSIREDAQRRLDEVKSWDLPDGPLPRKIWCMTGFRSNGEFYTDPAIAADRLRDDPPLGMNGYWEQNGGQPGALRENGPRQRPGPQHRLLAVRRIPAAATRTSAARPGWTGTRSTPSSTRSTATQSPTTRKRHPGGMPEVIADLMDEPAGLALRRAGVRAAFREYLRRAGLCAAAFFGKAAWDDVSPDRASAGGRIFASAGGARR